MVFGDAIHLVCLLVFVVSELHLSSAGWPRRRCETENRQPPLIAEWGTRGTKTPPPVNNSITSRTSGSCDSKKIRHRQRFSSPLRRKNRLPKHFFWSWESDDQDQKQFRGLRNPDSCAKNNVGDAGIRIPSPANNVFTSGHRDPSPADSARRPGIRIPSLQKLFEGAGIQETRVNCTVPTAPLACS
jgi:hypothetical protein